MRRPFVTAAALGAALAAGLATGCIDTRVEQTSRQQVDIRADTTLVGQIRLDRGNGFDPQAPGGADVVTYRNTTTRTFARLSISLSENLTTSQGTCIPLRPALSDTVLANVIPGAEVVLLTGILPSSLRVFVTEAFDGTTRLTSTLAGRWSGSYTEWRGTTPTVRPATGLSQSGGRLVVRAALPGDTLVAETQLSTPRPLSFTAYPNTCDALYDADLQSLQGRLVVGVDSITYANRTVGGVSTIRVIPDSFAVRLLRIP
ncbi:MAG: hypothetical protein MUF53_10850 [Gemmatimonadaceae bacterium]|nr:hypothetical protein [Gemmatimonadaceae bacterium]